MYHKADDICKYVTGSIEILQQLYVRVKVRHEVVNGLAIAQSKYVRNNKQTY